MELMPKARRAHILDQVQHSNDHEAALGSRSRAQILELGADREHQSGHQVPLVRVQLRI